MQVKSTAMTQADTEQLLLIEDDVDAADMLVEYLGAEGFSVRHSADGREGLDEALSHPPALVILDVMLPGMDGFEVLRRLHAKTSIPVLMLTARHDDIDRILGLELGADDYLAKPFNPRELVARIRAILRRVDDTRGTREVTELTLGQVSLSVSGRELQIAERPVEVTLSEFNILRTLLLNKEQVLSKEKLSLDALGRSLDVYDRSIDVHISHLRKKLKGSDVQIRTVRAVGYCIETH